MRTSLIAREGKITDPMGTYSLPLFPKMHDRIRWKNLENEEKAGGASTQLENMERIPTIEVTLARREVCP
jgi:hypothetical protein